MSDAPAPDIDRRARLPERLARIVALAGGTLSLIAAFLVVYSVTIRGLGIGAVPGDFEIVQIATALAVFSFLPYTQVRRGNIMVDTFTLALPAGVNRTIDALWDVVYAGFALLIGWQLSNGARESLANGLNSMVLGIPIGPVLMLCAALAVFLGVMSLVCAAARLADRA